jgi:putative heme-binding domain-containing protein
VTEAAQVLSGDFSTRSGEDLYTLLSQRDQRVRLKAQRELAGRGAAGDVWLTKAAVEPVLIAAPPTATVFNGPLLRRLHGIWGLGQLGRNDASAADPLIVLLKDPHFRIRAQAAKTLGDLAIAKAGPHLQTLLTDDNARVQAFAATAVGKVGHIAAIPALGALLKTNNNADAFLRNAAVVGLQNMNDLDAVLMLADAPSAAVRLAVLLVLRRTGDARITRFLDDKDERLVSEAIRAINDRRIDAAEPALATHLRRYIGGAADAARPSTLNFCRLMNAAVRQGRATDIQTLFDLSADPALPTGIRALALYRLVDWNEPYAVDRTIGQLRELPQGRIDGRAAIKRWVASHLADAEGEILAALYYLATVYELRLDPQSVERQVLTTAAHRDERIEALNVLLQNPTDTVSDTLEILLTDRDESIRLAGLNAMATAFPKQAEAHFTRLLTSNSVSERQAVVRALKTSSSAVAVRLLAETMEQLLAEKSGLREIELELVEACEARQEPAIKDALAAYRKSLTPDDTLADFRGTLYGGNKRAGRPLTRDNGKAQCLVCHSIRGGGGVVAPDLSKIGERATREYLLQSLIDPSAVVVPGYGNMTVTLKDGSTISGSLVKDGKEGLVLRMPDKSEKTVAVADLKTRSAAISTMPPMGTLMSKHEIRDIIDFLVLLNPPPKPAPGN